MSWRVKLRIHYIHRTLLLVFLTLTLLTAGLLGSLGWGHREVSATSPEAPQTGSYVISKYYLTSRIFRGADADGSDGNGAGVCAQGYHFASLWEILDPSNLKYNTVLGYTRDDSGYGPPSNIAGWVRTGYSTSNSGTPGQSNCNVWSRSDSGHSGTYSYLPSDWIAGGDLHVWSVGITRCDSAGRVWCVKDDIGDKVYLPLLFKN